MNFVSQDNRIGVKKEKNLLGLKSAPGSSPPDRVLPDGLTVRFYALESLVMLSSKITTSFLCSTSRFARSRTISATFV